MKPISSFKKQKSELSIILLTAIAFALGINLISSFASIWTEYEIILFVIGILLIAMSIYYINQILWSGMEMTLRVGGAIGIYIKNEQIINKKILGYKFNDDFFEYLNAFLSENPAYKKIFIKTINENIYDTSIFNPDDINFYSIINSVIELLYLSQLRLHLNEYFVFNEIDRKRITELSREDLTAPILKNRVLELITRDMKERAAFIDYQSDDSLADKGLVIYYAQGNNGAIYERFKLELPPNSSIKRNDKGFLEIENKLFKLTYRPRFAGFATFVPDELFEEENYADDEKDLYYNPYKVSVSLDILIKKKLFISDNELDIYEWLDSFTERLESYFSSDKLEQRFDLQISKLMESLVRNTENTAVNKNGD